MDCVLLMNETLRSWNQQFSASSFGEEFHVDRDGLLYLGHRLLYLPIEGLQLDSSGYNEGSVWFDFNIGCRLSLEFSPRDDEPAELHSITLEFEA